MLVWGNQDELELLMKPGEGNINSRFLLLFFVVSK